MDIDITKLEKLARGNDEEFAKEIQTMWIVEINKATKGWSDSRVRDFEAGFELSKNWFLGFMEYIRKEQIRANEEWYAIVANLVKRY